MSAREQDDFKPKAAGGTGLPRRNFVTQNSGVQALPALGFRGSDFLRTSDFGFRISPSLLPVAPRRRFASCAALAFLLFIQHSVFAETAGPASVPLQAPSVVFSVFRMIGALAIVFAVFLGGVWLFRNWQRLTVQRGKAPKLAIIEVKSLGPRHALYVIGYEQQRFLLSSAPTGVNLLTALPAAAEGAVETQPAALPSFAEQLMKALAPGNSRSASLRA